VLELFFVFPFTVFTNGSQKFLFLGGGPRVELWLGKCLKVLFKMTMTTSVWNGPSGPIRSGLIRNRGPDRTEPWSNPRPSCVLPRSGRTVGRPSCALPPAVLHSPKTGPCIPVPWTMRDRGPDRTVTRTNFLYFLVFFIIFWVLFDF
jgi:hypothetical protein